MKIVLMDNACNVIFLLQALDKSRKKNHSNFRKQQGNRKAFMTVQWTIEHRFEEPKSGYSKCSYLIAVQIAVVCKIV